MYCRNHTKFWPKPCILRAWVYIPFVEFSEIRTCLISGKHHNWRTLPLSQILMVSKIPGSSSSGMFEHFFCDESKAELFGSAKRGACAMWPWSARSGWAFICLEMREGKTDLWTTKANQIFVLMVNISGRHSIFVTDSNQTVLSWIQIQRCDNWEEKNKWWWSVTNAFNESLRYCGGQKQNT